MNRIKVMLPVLLMVALTGCIPIKVKPFTRSEFRLQAYSGELMEGCAFTNEQAYNDLAKRKDVENVGADLVKAGKTGEALDVFIKDAEAKPEDPAAFFNKGIVLKLLGRKQDAIEAFDKAIALKPDFDDAWIYKVQALFCDGRVEESVGVFNSYIDTMKTSTASDLNFKAFHLSFIGRFSDAAGVYGEAGKLDPKNYVAVLNKGAMLYYLGSYGESIKQYDSAIKIEPKNSEAYIDKGYSLLRLGRPKDALAMFEKAVSIGHDPVDGNTGKGYALIMMKKYGDAVKALDKALAVAPADRDALLCMGFAYQMKGKKGDDKTSGRILEMLLNQNLKDIVAVYSHGLLGRKDEMLKLMADLCKADPTLKIEFRSSPLLARYAKDAEFVGVVGE